MATRLLPVVLVALLAGCGGPSTGERVEVSGRLVTPPEGRVVPWPALESDEVPGGIVLLQGDLEGVRIGDEVDVSGVFHEYSIHHRSVIRVERIERR